LRFLYASAEALFMARLFVLAHDACHGSTWQVGHNTIHHAFSNYVWLPFSPEEFAALSPRRRAIERVCRSPFGLGLYYLIALWW
jgi:omega-6 fatty acid desaturase (delta-12 desaturase)